MPTESHNSSVPEESRYIEFITPLGFINQENETGCHFNSTNQLLYYNVLFRQLILNINCDTIMTCLDKSNKTFAYHYQKITTIKELQHCFGEIYLGGKKPFLLIISLLLQIYG